MLYSSQQEIKLVVQLHALKHNQKFNLNSSLTIQFCSTGILCIVKLFLEPNFVW